MKCYWISSNSGHCGNILYGPGGTQGTGFATRSVQKPDSWSQKKSAVTMNAEPLSQLRWGDYAGSQYDDQEGQRTCCLHKGKCTASWQATLRSFGVHTRFPYRMSIRTIANRPFCCALWCCSRYWRRQRFEITYSGHHSHRAMTNCKITQCVRMPIVEYNPLQSPLKPIFLS